MAEATYEEKQHEWTRRYYGSLVGMKCVGVETEEDEFSDGVWAVLLFQNEDGSPIEFDGEQYGGVKVLVSRDEEGNGPGFLMGLPDVPDKDNPFLRGDSDE